MEIEIVNIKKLKKYLMEKDLCLVIGPKYLIDKFCKDKGFQIDYMMFGNEPEKIYNVTDDIIYWIGLIDKNSLVNTISIIDMKIDEENLLGVKLTKKIYEDGCKNTVTIMDNNFEIDLSLHVQDIIDRRDRILQISYTSSSKS